MTDVRHHFRPGRLAGHALVLVAALVCFRLAWWQLIRGESTDGTVQNFGYALLWPAFGVAFIVMWVRFLRLEDERAGAEEQEHRDSFARMLADVESMTGQPPAADHIPTPSSDDQSSSTGTMDELNSSADIASAGFVGLVGDEECDDPELIAYNRALAALAEKDRRA